MTNKTEDKFYFGNSGQPERFASYGEVNTAAVNREARKYLETLNRVQPDEAHKQLYLQLKQRLQRDIQETQQAAERVKRGSDHPYDFWRISDLHRSMIEAGRYSQEAIRVMSRWIPDAFSRPGQPERFDKRMETEKWVSPKGTRYVAGMHEGYAGTFQPFISATYSDGGEQLMSGNAPTFKTKAGAEKWLRAAIDRIKSNYSRPGQPERFGLEDACWEGYEPVGTKQKDGRTVPNCVPKDKMTARAPKFKVGDEIAYKPFPSTTRGKIIRVHPASFVGGDIQRRTKYDTLEAEYDVRLPDGSLTRISEGMAIQFSRPGEKDKFSNGDRNRRLMQVLADADRQIANKVVSNIAKNYGIGTLQVFAEIFDSEAEDLMDYVTEPVRSSAFAILQKKGMMSRPGQPDKFDASSLNRGDFAEASTSPMLGKLLAAKVMPEGGWRAVQVGSDTLVISFEDADLASDFGRRVATKGYNATSPVQAIGRYWNVEVKNGK